MNIKITHNWLLEYLDTDATPQEIQKYLSLCGPSFERVDKVGDDYVYDIEVTTNRVDMASVFGIAQEAQAILPQFGKRAKLKFNPLEKYTFDSLNLAESDEKPLHITITDKELCPRFTTLVFSNIKIQPSPDIIRERLQLCDIKSINNVVDISNYLMLSLGQPTHMFNYDNIGKATMFMRESKKGEKLITLDGKEITLPGGDIVMEDGNGKLFDLCGIMGGENSAISEDTNTVVFFVQNYNKRKIRRTSMTTAQRTVAATYFEKGLDSERVEPTLAYGTELLQQFAHGEISSPLIDIYPHPYEAQKVAIDLSTIQNVMGVDISKKQVESILTNLGFSLEVRNDIHVTIPSFRGNDIEIKEDIVEEVARVYGYHNLPNILPIAPHVSQPKDMELLFNLQHKIKYFLKDLGLHESINYSMISEDLIQKLDLKKEDHIALANTISEEIKYMRIALIPSLIKNIANNEGKKDILKFFEIGKVYERTPKDLPKESYRLGIVTNTDFFDLKGILETLFRELNIENVEFKPSEDANLVPKTQADILIDGKVMGKIGQLKAKHRENLKIKGYVSVAQLDFHCLMENYRLLPNYKAPNTFANIKLDLSLRVNKDLTFATIKSLAMKTSSLLTNVEYIDLFNDTMTIRLYFSAKDRNISEEEAKKELEAIKKSLS